MLLTLLAPSKPVFALASDGLLLPPAKPLKPFENKPFQKISYSKPLKKPKTQPLRIL